MIRTATYTAKLSRPSHTKLDDFLDMLRVLYNAALENALHEVSLWQPGFLSPQRDAFNDMFAKPYLDGSAIDRLSISDVAIKFGWQWCEDSKEFDV